MEPGKGNEMVEPLCPALLIEVIKPCVDTGTGTAGHGTCLTDDAATQRLLHADVYARRHAR